MTYPQEISRLGISRLVVLASLLVLPRTAAADDSAEVHLKRGVRLLAHDQDREALEEFRTAYGLSPTVASRIVWK